MSMIYSGYPESLNSLQHNLAQGCDFYRIGRDVSMCELVQYNRY